MPTVAALLIVCFLIASRSAPGVPDAMICLPWTCVGGFARVVFAIFQKLRYKCDSYKY